MVKETVDGLKEIGKSVGNLVKDVTEGILKPPPKKTKLYPGVYVGIALGSFFIFVCLIYCIKGFLENPECL